MYKFYILIGFFISLFIPRTKKIWVFGENELTVLKPFYEFSSIQNDGIKKIYISAIIKELSIYNQKDLRPLIPVHFLRFITSSEQSFNSYVKLN